MAADIIHDRGRGPEIVGTRITVFNLLPHFLDPTATEDFICRHYGLTQEQVSSARAYVLNHADTVLARHRQIEARMAEGNSPEVVAQAERTHAAFLDFKHRLAERHRVGANGGAVKSEGDPPTFRKWLSERDPRLAERK